MEILNEINYNNVFYKSYTFPFMEMPQVLRKFKEEFASFGLHENGMYFYSMNAIKRTSDTEADVTMVFYQPAVEDVVPENCKLDFVDRFAWDDMTYRIIDNNPSVTAEVAYYELIKEAEQKGKKIISPFFNEVLFREDENGEKKPVCIVKVKMV